MSSILQHIVERAEQSAAMTDPDVDADVLEAMQRIHTFGAYGYRPDLGGAITFTAVFGILAFALTVQGARHRCWWMLYTMALGSWLECAGNGVRIYSHFYPDAVDPYIGQQVILVLTPALFATAHFSVLSKICRAYGQSYIAPVRAQWLIPFFVAVDMLSLIVQGAGSGLAAEAETNDEAVTTINEYGDIVVAGLAIQLAGYFAFNVLFVIFVLRAYADKGKGQATWLTKRFSLFLLATWTSAFFVLGRSIFRLIEMIMGWVGELATIEWYYLVFDATLVAIAVTIMTFFSPVYYMPQEDGQQTKKQSDLEEVNVGETDLDSNMDESKALIHDHSPAQSDGLAAGHNQGTDAGYGDGTAAGHSDGAAGASAV